MPHDVKGQPLKAGDAVTMKFTVLSVTENEKDCNVTLQAVDALGVQTYLPSLTCNARLTTRD